MWGAVTWTRSVWGEVKEGEGQEIKEKEKMERRRRGEEWKVEGVKKCPVRTHRRPMNLNCGISGIQTQSPNGNYHRRGGEGGRLQAKNVKRTVHAASVLSVRCASWADFLMFSSDRIKSSKTKKTSCCFLSARRERYGLKQVTPYKKPSVILYTQGAARPNKTSFSLLSSVFYHTCSNLVIYVDI